MLAESFGCQIGRPAVSRSFFSRRNHLVVHHERRALGTIRRVHGVFEVHQCAYVKPPATVPVGAGPCGGADHDPPGQRGAGAGREVGILNPADALAQDIAQEFRQIHTGILHQFNRHEDKVGTVLPRAEHHLAEGRRPSA